MVNIEKMYKIKDYNDRNFRNYLLKFMKKEVSLFNKYYKIDISMINKDNNKEISIISSIVSINVDNERYIFARKATVFLTNITNKLGIKSFTICYKFKLSNFNEYKDYLKSLKINNLTTNKSSLHTKVSRPAIKNNFYSKEINLKQNLNEFNLRQYLFKFFNSTNFNSNYIFVIVKISYQEVFEVKTMFNKTIINLNNNQDKINYIENVIKYFNDRDYGYHAMSGDRIIINWLDSNKQIYNRIQRNKKDLIRLSEVPNYYDIPWNVKYERWGQNLETFRFELK